MSLLYPTENFVYPFLLMCNVYYESLKREVKTKPIYEFRCDERLKTKVEESTRLACTLLCAELEHLKIETRLIDEMFANLLLSSPRIQSQIVVYFQQNKKRRKPKVKIVTLQLCEVRKSRYSLYEKLPTCAA